MTQNKNELTIVGTLVEDKTEKTVSSKNGKSYIRGSVIVKSKGSLHEIRVLCGEQNANGTLSKLYPMWEKVGELVGKKVRVSGGLQENRFWSQRTNACMSRQDLVGRFISENSSSAEDSIVIKMSGFVAQPLTEKVNQKGEVYMHEIVLGQSYQKKDGTYNLSLFKFQVNHDSPELVKAIERLYVQDKTVEIEATIDDEVVTVEAPHVAFGKPTETTRNYKYTYITSGYDPIVDETSYTPTEIEESIKAYNAKDVEIAADAQNRASQGKIGVSSEPAPVKTQRVTRLMGL